MCESRVLVSGTVTVVGTPEDPRLRRCDRCGSRGESVTDGVCEFCFECEQMELDDDASYLDACVEPCIDCGEPVGRPGAVVCRCCQRLAG